MDARLLRADWAPLVDLAALKRQRMLNNYKKVYKPHAQIILYFTDTSHNPSLPADRSHPRHSGE